MGPHPIVDFSLDFKYTFTMGTELPRSINFPNARPVQGDFIPVGEFRIEAVLPSEIPQYRTFLLAGIAGMPYSSEADRQGDISKRTVDYFQEALDHPEEWTLLAAKDADGTIIGALEARIAEIPGEKRVGFVNWIGVDEKSRQKGTAVDLYQEYEQRMRVLGDVTRIMAHVHNANLPSLALHRKLGITQVFAERGDGGRGKWYYKSL